MSQTSSDTKTSIRQWAVVTDLDGTLIRGNSLKWILKAGLKRLLRQGRIPSFLAVMMLGGLAWTKLISHETMKYGALRLFGNDKKLLDEMHSKGIEHRNQEVQKILADAEKHGDRILLASAASESYIHQLWDGETIASPFGGPDLKGKRKLEAVKTWLEDNNLQLKAFLTDHSDDLPLAEYAQTLGATIYLVNPTQKSQDRFDAAGISYKLIM